MYVVWVTEHLRDGVEECAVLFDSLEKAVAYINGDRFAKDNHSFRLFKLGKEIPLKKETVKAEAKVIVKEHQIYKVDA